MALLVRSIMVDGDYWGGIYTFEKAGDIFPEHVHLTEDDNHITVVMAGGIICHGHPDHEGVELVAKPGERDGMPIVNWVAGQPHGFTAMFDGTQIANWRKVRSAAK